MCYMSHSCPFILSTLSCVRLKLAHLSTLKPPCASHAYAMLYACIMLYARNMIYAYIVWCISTRVLNNFTGFRNVRKNIETSGDISVLWLITFLWGSEVLNPLECTQDHSTKNLGLLNLTEMCMWWVKVLRCLHLFYAFSGIGICLYIGETNFAFPQTL